MLNLRSALASFVILVVFTFVATSAFAQSPNPTPPGNHLGPPGLSVIPVDGPEDIPLLRAQIEAYIEKIKEYVASLFSNQAIANNT